MVQEECGAGNIRLVCFLAKTPVFYYESERPRCRQMWPSSSSPQGLQTLPKQPHGSRNQGWVRPREQTLRRPILGFRGCGRSSPPGSDAQTNPRTEILPLPCSQQSLGTRKSSMESGKEPSALGDTELSFGWWRGKEGGFEISPPFCRMSREFEGDFKAQ